MASVYHTADNSPIPGLDTGMASVGNSMSAWAHAILQKRDAADREKMWAGILQEPQKPALDPNNPDASPAPPDPFAGARTLFWSLGPDAPKILGRVMGSEAFTPAGLKALTALIRRAAYWTLSGEHAAKYLGLPDFTGGVIQVNPDNKVDVVVKPPALEKEKDLKPMGDGWYFDPTDRQMKRYPNYFQEQYALRTAGATRVNQSVSPTAIWKDTMGAAAAPFYKGAGEAFNQSQSDASNAQQGLATIKELNRLLADVQTGTWADKKTAVLKGMQGLGIPVDASRVGNAEAAQNLMAETTMKIMKGLGGNDTTEERQWASQTNPGTLMTPEGRKTVERLLERKASRLDKQASYDAQMLDKTASGVLGPGEAQRLSRAHMGELLQQDAGSFQPGAFTAPTAPGATKSKAPVITPLPSGSPVDKYLEKYGH